MDRLAQTLSPPCRLARRYDADQRREAIRALYALGIDGSGCSLRLLDLDLGDVVDAVALELDLFMSPDTRDLALDLQPKK